MNLSNLLNTKTGKQLVKTYHDEQDGKRSKLFAEMDTLRKNRDAEIAPLNDKLKQATDDCVEAQTKLEAAKIRERTANSKLGLVKASYSSQVARIEKELKATAPESIDTFCDELKEEMQELRSKGVTRSHDKTNARSITLRLESIRDSITKAQALKLLPIADTEDRLQALRVGLPELYMQ